MKVLLMSLCAGVLVVIIALLAILQGQLDSRIGRKSDRRQEVDRDEN